MVLEVLALVFVVPGTLFRGNGRSGKPLRLLKQKNALCPQKPIPGPVVRSHANSRCFFSR